MKKRIMNLKTVIIILSVITIGIIILISYEVNTMQQFFKEKAAVTFYDHDNRKVIELRRKEVSQGEVKTIASLEPSLSKKIMIQTIIDHKYRDSKGRFFYGIRRQVSSVYLDHFIPKNSLTEYYLNELYFQKGIIGMGTAAQYYFNKEVKDLTLIQLIYLLTISDRAFQNDISQSLEKRIKMLSQQKVISNKVMKDILKQEPLLFVQLKNNKYASMDSYLATVTNEIAADLKISDQQIMHNNLKIYTSLDRQKQKIMFNEFNQDENFPKDPSGKYLFDASMVLMNHETGEIVGLIGGRNTYSDFEDKAVDLKRQPGSTFKPLVVFGPAIDLGWKASDILIDKPLHLGSFKPLNYDYRYRQQVTLKEGLTMSYNVPTVWLLTQIGLNTGVKYMNQFGLFRYDMRDNYRIALGYLTNGVSPLKMAQSYTVFSNNGQMVSSYTVRKIENQKDRILFKHKPAYKKIFQTNTAIQIQSILRNVVENGTGKAAKIDHKIVYGKTGTTSYDGWFVGSTDEFTSAIWVGTKKKYPNFNDAVEGGSYPSQIYKTVISQIAK